MKNIKRTINQTPIHLNAGVLIFVVDLCLNTRCQRKPITIADETETPTKKSKDPIPPKTFSKKVKTWNIKMEHIGKKKIQYAQFNFSLLRFFNTFFEKISSLCSGSSMYICNSADSTCN